MRARWMVFRPPPSVPSSRFPQTRHSTVLCLLVPNMPRKRKRCWTADAWWRLDSSFAPQFGSEQDLGSPEALIPRDEESSEDDRPFLPRSLLQEIIFAHRSFTTGQAFKGICWAEQIGFVCEELQKQNARSTRFENSRPVIGAARANISVQRSAPRRTGPCRRQCLLTNSAGSQIKCLGLGAWAEQTALAPRAQTVSTTQIRTTGKCVGKRTQNGRKAALQPGVSLCFSFARSRRERV